MNTVFWLTLLALLISMYSLVFEDPMALILGLTLALIVIFKEKSNDDQS